MRTAHRSPTELLKALGGFLAAAGAVGAYFAGALAGLNRLLPEWLQLSDAAVKTSATAVAAAGAFLIWHALRTRSRLLRPEALLISPNRPEHLAGRSDDIEELRRICSANPLVFLIGESGAGKSALLQAGLIPNAPSAFLPIYLQHWGEDWEKGPWQSLAVSLFEGSPPELRQQLGGSGTSELTDYARRLRSMTGKRLLLVLDQFDDYVSAHQARFVCSSVWIDADTLQRQNTFWRSVAELVGSDEAHVIVATRADAAAALDSIRLTESPIRFSLGLLRDSVVEPLLRKLTDLGDGAAPVISDPENGWFQLEARLARDLSSGGAVLPAQMRLVFAGLDNLNPLTVASYERLGGGRGIEAAHVRHHVAQAARVAGMPEETLLRVLLEMADQTHGKTVARPVDELLAAIGPEHPSHSGQTSVAAIEASLSHLIRKQLVRRITDPERGGAAYSLAHDYLCQAVIELHRGANRWQRLLDERYTNFKGAAGDLWRQYQALLSPRETVMMLIAGRCRGKLRYGDARRYATLSIARMFPALLILAVFAAGAGALSDAQHEQGEVYFRRQAEDILNRTGRRGEPLSDREKQGFGELASQYSAPDALALKLSFLHAALSGPELADRFVARREHFLTALWGTDAALADWLCKRACWPVEAPSSDRHILTAQAVIGAALPDFDPVLMDSVLTNLEFEHFESREEQELAQHVTHFATRADPEYAAKAFFRYLVAIQARHRATPLDALVLCALATRLDQDSARRGRESVLRWKQDTSSYYWPRDATAATFVLLAALSGKDKAEVDAAFAQAFPDRSPNESLNAPSWRVRAAVNSAAAMVLAELPPAVRGPQVVRIAYYGSKRLSDQDPPASVDDSFFSLLSKASAGIDPADADRAFLGCDGYAAGLYQPNAPSLRQACRAALAANVSTATAEAFALRATKDRRYSDHYGWLPVASRVSSRVAAELLRQFMRPDTFYPESIGAAAILAFRVDESDARQFLRSGPVAAGDPGALFSTLQLIGEQRSFLPILRVTAAGAERARLVPAVFRANSTCCIVDLALTFAALSGDIPSGEIPRAFEIVERLFLNEMHQSVPPGSSNQVTSRAAERKKLTLLVPAMRKWGAQLDGERRRATLGTWIEELSKAAPEDVSAYSPVLLGLIGPGDARALLDLLKRPDCVAQPQMQQAAIEALRALLNFEGTDYWDAVRGSKAHGLDVVSAPSSDVRHFLR